MAEEEKDKDAEAREDDVWSVDSLDPTPRVDGEPGPDNDWPYPSWYSRVDNDWWWNDGKRGWTRDPCPAQPLGAVGGEYVFITPFGERRRFTSGQLHGRGGLVDLFSGSMWWAKKHFTRFDAGEKVFKGNLQAPSCIAALIRACQRAGYYDERQLPRGPGVWRDRGGLPVLNVGLHIFHNGARHEPGVRIGKDVYVRGTAYEAPTHEASDKYRSFKWLPAEVGSGRTVSTHLDQWAWTAPGEHGASAARDLFQGALHCSMLGSWLRWLVHVFVEAPYGAGKSTLLLYARALLGGAAHDLQSNYTRSHFEQNFEGCAMAFLVNELERDSDPDMARKIIELARLLSDDSASGGRGTSSGKGRSISIHGAMLMAATLTEEWAPQDRSRITLLELQSFRDRGPDHPPAPPEVLADMIQRAEEMSPHLRARALSTVDLFTTNLKVAREAILRMGGDPRDADQLGNAIAGWRTMTSDEPLDPDNHEEFVRFRPFIVSLQAAEDGEDEPNELLNLLFGLAHHDAWKGGQRLTVGQLIARARDDGGSGAREDLAPIGLRLERRKDETWDHAWLLIANKHPGLDDLFEKARKPRYVGKKRSTILKQLRGRDAAGTEWRAVPSEEPSRLRFAGTQSRFLQIPPFFLPSVSDEKEH